ncbi:MAG: hypothetical protein AVDCRST_MAG31-592, partial [uncultured Sphingomonas sp.]
VRFFAPPARRQLCRRVPVRAAVRQRRGWPASARL